MVARRLDTFSVEALGIEEFKGNFADLTANKSADNSAEKSAGTFADRFADGFPEKSAGRCASNADGNFSTIALYIFFPLHHCGGNISLRRPAHLLSLNVITLGSTNLTSAGLFLITASTFTLLLPASVVSGINTAEQRTLMLPIADAGFIGFAEN